MLSGRFLPLVFQVVVNLKSDLLQLAFGKFSGRFFATNDGEAQVSLRIGAHVIEEQIEAMRCIHHLGVQRIRLNEFAQRAIALINRLRDFIDSVEGFIHLNQRSRKIEFCNGISDK
jgi:hypothetical protein